MYIVLSTHTFVSFVDRVSQRVIFIVKDEKRYQENLRSQLRTRPMSGDHSPTQIPRPETKVRGKDTSSRQQSRVVLILPEKVRGLEGDTPSDSTDCTKHRRLEIPESSVIIGRDGVGLSLVFHRSLFSGTGFPRRSERVKSASYYVRSGVL